ncbi:unnamed protein product [Cuscuta campestris]|uniref:RNase H type-1 domain-containing protein n=1 Tax=Cuscuta campestris TaxID=132261 RepID=A0A484K6Z3_9ASTE|nr:unnamed protein product [Cuscuta campestris]
MDQISRVPLQLDSEDKWYWAGETHGEYSVKEAYRRLTRSLVEWMEYQFSKLSVKELKFVAGVIWAIWRARNKAVWDHYIPSPQSVVSWVREALLDPPNKTGQSGRQESMQVSPRSEHRVFRCYVDAAIFPSSKEVAFGSVIFDSGGSFYAAKNRMMQCSLEPVMAEAMACREALTWARANEIQDVELLTDCRWVVEALFERNIQVFSYLGTIIKDWIKPLFIVERLGMNTNTSGKYCT